jgi:hypothetical protein
MTPFFPSEDDFTPPWDHEQLANEQAAVRRRRARDADSMAETGIPYYDQDDENESSCKQNTP